MMLVEESSMQSIERLPLFIAKFIRFLRLLLAYFDALLLHHHQAGIDSFNLVDKLLLCDWFGVRLLKDGNWLGVQLDALGWVINSSCCWTLPFGGRRCRVGRAALCPRLC